MLQMTLTWHKAPYLQQFELHLIYILIPKKRHRTWPRVLWTDDSKDEMEYICYICSRHKPWRATMCPNTPKAKASLATVHKAGGPRRGRAHTRTAASPRPPVQTGAPRFPFAATPEKPSGLRSPGWLGRGDRLQEPPVLERCGNTWGNGAARPGPAQRSGRAEPRRRHFSAPGGRQQWGPSLGAGCCASLDSPAAAAGRWRCCGALRAAELALLRRPAPRWVRRELPAGAVREGSGSSRAPGWGDQASSRLGS